MKNMRKYAAIFTTVFCGLFPDIMASKGDSIAQLCATYVPKDYELDIRPRKDDHIKIYNSLQILGVLEIDEGNMDYLLHAFFKMMWEDSRLKRNNTPENINDPVTLPKECSAYVWQPQVFFLTAKSIQTFEESAAMYMQVYADGKLSISTRYLFRCSCFMDFHTYPFDSQSCEFSVCSLLPDAESALCWADEKHSPLKEKAVVVIRKIEPLQFTFRGVIQKKYTDMVPDGNYTCLVAELIFDRRIITSVINTYIPSTLIVFMSWLGFWIKVDAVPARVTLSVTSLLTLCTQVQQYQSQLPPVNYIKAMDIWLFVCIFLVFSTLLEFALAYNVNESKGESREEEKCGQEFLLSNSAKKRKWRTSSSDKDENVSRRNLEPFERSSENTSASYKNPKCWTWCRCLRPPWKTDRVDDICKILYPVLFLIFAIIYWTHYLKIYYNLH